jgi:hypothetical protein
MRDALRVFAGATVCSLVTFGYRYLSFSEFSNDHFVHLSIAQQITRGALPVRDFVERGFPLMSIASAGAQVVLAEGLRSELVLIALFFAVAAGLTYVVALRISHSVVVAAMAVAVSVLAYPVSYAYPKLLAPAMGCVAGWRYCVAPSSGRLVLVALSIAVSFLLRHDLGVLLGVGIAAMLVARHGWSRQCLVETSLVAAITVLTVSPYLIWVQTYQGVRNYIEDGLVFSQREAQRANWWGALRFSIETSGPLLARLGHGPVVNVRWQDDASAASIIEAEIRHGLKRLDANSPQSWQYELARWSPRDLESLVKDPVAADTNGIDRSTFALQVPAPRGLAAIAGHLYGPGEGLHLAGNAIVLFFYLLWILPLAAIVALAARWQRESQQVRPMVIMLVALQLTMNVTMLRDPLDTRMRDVVVPLSLVLAYLVGLIWSAPGTRMTRVVFKGAAVVALVVVAGSAAVLGRAADQLERTQVAAGVSGLQQRLRTIRRTLAPPDQRTGPRSPVYQPLLDYITRCTTADDRLLTLTFAPELFFYSGRLFAGGQVSLSPGYFTRDRDASLMLARMSHERVPLVIMDNQTQREMLSGYPRIGSYVAAHYQTAIVFPLTSEKAFVVLARNSMSAGAESPVHGAPTDELCSRRETSTVLPAPGV